MKRDVATVPFTLPFEDVVIRSMIIDGKQWFVAADICRILGIKNVADSLKSLDKDAKGKANSYTLGGEQSVLIVDENGLNTLVMRSHAAIEEGTVAYRFRRWVTRDVIPSIMKTGRYELASSKPKVVLTFEQLRVAQEMADHFSVPDELAENFVRRWVERGEEVRRTVTNGVVWFDTRRRVIRLN